MAKTLKRHVNTATFEWNDNSIDLRASFSALEALSDSVGIDAITYIMGMSSPRELLEVVYFLQHESEYERDDIWEAFFSSALDFMDPQFQVRLGATIGILLGADKKAILEELAKLNAPEDTQKKSAD